MLFLWLLNLSASLETKTWFSVIFVLFSYYKPFLIEKIVKEIFWFCIKIFSTYAIYFTSSFFSFGQRVYQLLTSIILRCLTQYNDLFIEFSVGLHDKELNYSKKIHKATHCNEITSPRSLGCRRSHVSVAVVVANHRHFFNAFSSVIFHYKNLLELKLCFVII